MKVRSARFGEFEVGDEAVIHFPGGLAPFGKELDFVLLAGAEMEGGGDSEASFGRPLRRHTAKATALMDGIDPAQGRDLSSNRQRHGGMRRASATTDGDGGCGTGARPAYGEGGRLEGQELAWLQSLQMPQLGFWVGHAGKLFPERDIGIEARHLQSVDVEHVEQLCILLILTIEQEQVTANLLAPVVVNMEAGIGRQVVVAGNIEEVRVPVPTCRVAA